MKPLTLALTLLLGLLGASARAQGPVPGQPYAIPQGYESYSPGSLITYGSYNYVIQDNATMLLADSQDSSGTDDGTADDDSVPVDTTAYQIPPGYEDAQPGSQISYGGNDYTVLSGGTMMMCNPGYSIMDGTLYQIPPAYAGAGVGSIVTYGGFSYLVKAGVMIKININPGYGTKTIPGQLGSNLSQSGKNSSKKNQGQQPHWPNQTVQQPHWPNQTAQQPHWPNQAVQQPHWSNQTVQQPRRPNQTVQQPRWPNQTVQQPRTANRVYSRGYSGVQVGRRR
jgi:hypothetical protein